MVSWMSHESELPRWLRGGFLAVLSMLYLLGCENQGELKPVSGSSGAAEISSSDAASTKPVSNVAVLEALPPRPKGDYWLRLTTFGAETDSICIGNGRNATCAVETYLACIARRDNALCAIAQNVPKLVVQYEPSDKRRIFDYRFRRLGPFTRKDLPRDLDVDWRPASGDLLAVVDVIECVLDQKWLCRPFTGPLGHFVYLRRTGNLWYVADSHEPPS
jgi:hypothetical protein